MEAAGLAERLDQAERARVVVVRDVRVFQLCGGQPDNLGGVLPPPLGAGVVHLGVPRVVPLEPHAVGQGPHLVLAQAHAREEPCRLVVGIAENSEQQMRIQAVAVQRTNAELSL